MKSWQLRRHLTSTLSLLVTLLLLAGVPLGAYADSQRFAPDTGYAAQDIDMAAPYDLAYSAGLDVVYANVSTAEAPTRAFVHEQSDMSMSTMDVQLFNYNGVRAITLYSHNGGMWPQVTKHIGDEIWFSYTGGSGAGYYSVPWDPTLAIYPVATATAEVITDYNWEVEEDPDGRIFVCGATGMSGGQSIGYVDEANGNTVVAVIDIGGNSSGFAVDSSGNIWSGEYILSFSPSMHIEPCRLGMWSKADIDTAISSGTPLSWSDADVTIDLGTTTITGDTTNWGPNDIEADGEGNVYISLNTYAAWASDSTWGSVRIYSEDGGSSYTPTTLGTTIQRTGNGEWDWARSISFDGNGQLNDGGYTDPTQGGPSANILYLDMDLGAGYADYDQVVAIAVDADYDSDGVPDSVDNAPETANAGQQDTDGDHYGNIVDGDFNNDNSVNFNDYNMMSSSWGNSIFDEQLDMNSDGSLNYEDFNSFSQKWGTSGPWY
jgi:hypothetical protein